MKVLRLFVLLFMAGYSLAIGAGEYQISGTVTKKGGGPLKGVSVLLKGKDVTVVTGADGKFEFVPPIAIRMKAPETQTLAFQLHGNIVKFSPVGGALNGNVSILSGSGRRVASVDFSALNPATDQISLPQFASGLNIVRVTINNTVHTCQVIHLGNDLHLINKNNISRSGDVFTLARVTAAAVDTIVTTLEGYEKSVTPIESYTLSDVAIEMDSIVESSEIAWGKAEDPTIGFKDKIPPLAEFNALKANLKLPDPLMKLDGTRITSRSEWAYRREEILQSLYKYILGEKPIPAKGSVTGTVSTSKITVNVSEGGKSCSFSVTVSMNGATQPAPAIIIYDGGMGSSLPIPTGVAKITFSAIESQGGSGAKTGPFFTFYGSNHPAGYMVAQAWQVSRIIDLLEEHPDVIDPYRIGVTGCSRNGKGAFFGGVLDNRVALTIPCESGMGGTVGLRLKKQLDPGDNNTAEWPYHAISYVRWLSEVALGKFATANSASGDKTEMLPVDMHDAMAMIAPRAIYIVDNPGISNLDPKSAYVTGSAGKAIFEALGVGDNFAYQGASGSHCQWRSQYNASLSAMSDKFLLGKTSTQTGTFSTDLGSKPDAKSYYDWTDLTLDGEL